VYTDVLNFVDKIGSDIIKRHKNCWTMES